MSPRFGLSFKKHMHHSVSKMAATFDAALDAGYCHWTAPNALPMIGMTSAIDPSESPSSPPPSIRPDQSATGLAVGIDAICKLSPTP